MDPQTRGWPSALVAGVGVGVILVLAYGCQPSAQPVRTSPAPHSGASSSGSPAPELAKSSSSDPSAIKDASSVQLVPEGPQQPPPHPTQPPQGATVAPVAQSSPLAAQVPQPRYGRRQDPPSAKHEDASDSTSHAPPKPKRGKKNPVDPVQANGPIFQNWPKPRLVLIFSGQQWGYIEPCGCAGLENMKGGLARRFTFVKQLKKQGWNPVAFDLGGQVRRQGRQAQIKFHYTLDALRLMGYGAVGLGPQDLKLPPEEILTELVDESTPLVCANLTLLDFPAPSVRVVEQGGIRIGAVAVLSPKLEKQIQNDQIRLAPMHSAVEQALRQLKQKQCQLLLLLCYASVQEARELARVFPQFHFVVAADRLDEPPAQPQKLNQGRSWLIRVGHKGMYVVAVGVYGPEAQQWKYQRVPVDARFPNAPEIDQRMAAYQEQLKELGWEGLGLRALPHPKGTQFVGSQVCGECHTKAYQIWKNTPHAHATRTLEQLNPPRHFDPECISCHATGWEPQRYVPYHSGYDSLDKTPHLRANGCENCHGPGSRHVAIEMGEVDASALEVQAARASMRVTLEEAKQRTCLQCHDLDNSPDYIKLGFEAYWPQIEHHGTD